jgi:hypothetical protein
MVISADVSLYLASHFYGHTILFDQRRGSRMAVRDVTKQLSEADQQHDDAAR